MSLDCKGRPRADVWEIFTSAEAPQRQAASECRHCGALVAHAKKSERAKAHLARRCPPFRALMLAVGDAALRPDWFNELSVRRKRAASMDAVAALPAADKAAKGVATHTKKPKLGQLAATPEALAELLAMHFYVTGTPFAAVEDAFLLHAFRSCAPRVELPDRQALGGALLDRCYEKLHALAARKEAARPEASATDTSSLFSSSASGAVLQACVVMIEEIFAPKPKSLAAVAAAAPGSATSSQQTASNPFQHLVAFVRECTVVSTYFTKDAHSKRRLEQEQQVLHLEPLARFTPTVSRPGVVSWHWAELKPFLDRIKASEDILFEVVTGTEFLSGRSSGEASGADGDRLVLRQRVHRIVAANSFFEDLEKSIQILGPIHEVMEIARAAQSVPGATPSSPSTPPPPISNAYQSLCETMQETYDKMLYLSEDESAFLRALLTTTRLAVGSGSDAGVAYLLDPRYLGAGMSGDERDSAEDHLFDFFRRGVGDDGGDGVTTTSTASAVELEQKKEALFQEYTRFVIKSSSFKSQGSFRYQMLVKGTKTIAQFWATDGKQYPLLQQVALSIFSSPDGDGDSGGNSDNSAVWDALPGPETSAAPPKTLIAPPVVATVLSPAASPLSAASPMDDSQSGRDELNRVQREKLAFVKKHAALLLCDVVSGASPGAELANGVALRHRSDAASTDSSGRDLETE